jgi:hypothetical protein
LRAPRGAGDLVEGGACSGRVSGAPEAAVKEKTGWPLGPQFEERGAFWGEGDAASLRVMAADDRLNTDRPRVLAPIAGSSPNCFPTKAKCGHWRERVILNKSAPGLRADSNLKSKVASVQEMDRLGGGERYKGWQREFLR